MSMPNSRVEVATTARSSPFLSLSSISNLCSRDTDPWWARATSSSASRLSSAARRSARARLLTKKIVERWVSNKSSNRGYIAGHIDGLAVGESRVSGVVGCSISGTGTTISMSRTRSLGASTISTALGVQLPLATVPPVRNSAMAVRGRCVAESPIRWGRVGHNLSSRSSETVRCDPLFVPAIA